MATQIKNDEFELVKKYLQSHKITYGSVVSSLDVLEYAQIEPNEFNNDNDHASKEVIDAANAMAKYEYMKFAEKVADELVRQLQEFGFAADKVNRSDHNKVTPHIKGCTVYTRWQWDVAYKGRKAAQLAEKGMEMLHDTYVDTTELKNVAPDVYDAAYQFLDMKKELATEFRALNEPMWEKFDDFHELLMTKKDDLVKYFKDKQPTNYGNYSTESEDK